MTINQLMESVLGKSCAVEGVFGDSTPFTSSSIPNEESGKSIAEQLCDRLGMNGFQRCGNEILYNGMTGEPMGMFFIGPVYYQRLKHLVSDKLHARASGPVTTLTRQPLEGRSRDGGLRFGKPLPKWYGNILLVCGIAGDTSKLRGQLVFVYIF
jgi:DNA-directed RNA polymerase beta subunit